MSAKKATQKSTKSTTAIGKKSQGIHGRGTSRDEGARPRAKGGSAPHPARRGAPARSAPLAHHDRPTERGR